MSGVVASGVVANGGDSPRRRVVLLGASNLVRGISTVIETARLVWGGPLDVLAALGHGRSYGMKSSVLGRSLPGIAHCGLWEALDRRPAAPTAALITDVGNDLLYGADVEQIAGWVDGCLARLADRAARLIVTALPMDGLRRLGPLRYVLFRSILFPTCRLDLAAAIDRAEHLNERLLRLAERYEAIVVRPNADWYAWDPIHIRLRCWPAAWRDVLNHWTEEEAQPVARGSISRWSYLRSLRPLTRRIFGFEQRRTQPAGKLRDGSLVSLY